MFELSLPKMYRGRDDVHSTVVQFIVNHKLTILANWNYINIISMKRASAYLNEKRVKLNSPR